MPDSRQLRILHWNIHSWLDSAGNANTVAVAALFAETSPDIVSLTEVDETWGAPGQLRKAADHAGYSWIFVPAFEFGEDHPRGGFGNALLTRLPILAVQQWQLLWPPRVYDGSEPSEQRPVLVARLGYAGSSFWAGVVHLPRSDGQARAAALARVRALSRELDEPWLICGDFNTPASSWISGDADIAVSPSHLTYPATQPAEAIDYCIGSSAVRFDAEVLTTQGSDHLAQLITVMLPGTGAHG